MIVLIEKKDWMEPEDIFEGTITFFIKDHEYRAFSFGYDYKEGSNINVDFVQLEEDLSWEDIFNNNINREKRLNLTGEWSYDGYGEIISINPVIADFGDIILDLGDWSNDRRIIGEYIFWKIIRLSIYPIGKEMDIK